MTVFTEDVFKGKNFTLSGRIYHPALLEPKASKLSPEKLKFSVQFAWLISSQTAQTQEILNWIAQGKALMLPQVPEQVMQSPVKKWGETFKADGTAQGEHLKDCYWMNVSSNPSFKPALVDEAGQTVADPARVYSGSNALVNFKFWKFAHGNNFGFAANLNAVCLQGGGERVAFGGISASEAFKGFLKETAVAPANQFAPPAQPAQPANQFAPPAQPAQPANQFAPPAQPAPQPRYDANGNLITPNNLI